MILESRAFVNGQTIPAKYTCDGENINPPLTIRDIPQDTVSLALIIDDPDAPSGIWTHWVLWNISPEYIDIEEGVIPPEAVQGITSFGNRQYSGPCPPKPSEHRYFFKLYALDKTINLPPSSGSSDLESAMSNYILAQAELMCVYGRN